MSVKITLELALDDRQVAGLQAALVINNESPYVQPISTVEDYLNDRIMRMVNDTANIYDPATTNDVAVLRERVRADPQAVKDALDAAVAARAEPVGDRPLRIDP